MDGGHSIAATGFAPATEAAPTRRGSWRPRLGAAATALALPVALLGVWQLTGQYGLLPAQILPPLHDVAAALRDGLADGSLQDNTLVSLRRVIEGFLAGSVLGLLVGAAIGLSHTLRRMLEPSFLALAQVPVFGWVPILVLLVGLDEAPKLIVIGWSAFVPVMLNTAQGIRDVPPALLELGRVLAFSRWGQFRTIVLPAAVPPIFTGLREALANSWQALVAVELLASFEGLGYMMAYGRQLFQLEMVMAAAIVIGVIGLALHLSLAAVEHRLQRWRVVAAR
jgi:sulfonate transport system permease protein